MISDMENMEVMIGRNNYAEDDSEFGDFARRPESPNYETLIDHNSNSNSNSRENEIRRFTENWRKTTEISLDSKEFEPFIGRD